MTVKPGLERARIGRAYIHHLRALAGREHAVGLHGIGHRQVVLAHGDFAGLPAAHAANAERHHQRGGHGHAPLRAVAQGAADAEGVEPRGGVRRRRLRQARAQLLGGGPDCVDLAGEVRVRGQQRVDLGAARGVEFAIHIGMEFGVGGQQGVLGRLLEGHFRTWTGGRAGWPSVMSRMALRARDSLDMMVPMATPSVSAASW
ncbi:hypothetical protein D3C86_1484400 [compost metagenome]